MTKTLDLIALSSDFVGAFNEHDLDKIMSFFAPDGKFVGTDGVAHEGDVAVRAALGKSLIGLNKFIEQDAFVDIGQGKVLTQWQCLMTIGGQARSFHGLDILHWRDGKLIYKSAFTKAGIAKAGQMVGKS